ncbi:MAG: hypothetical protein RMA76_36235 [Deltaproteobacteria bacterium]|jgi:hypothetical protein
MRRPLFIAALTLAACSVDPPGEGDLEFPCTTDDDCVDGYTCQANVCRTGARDGGAATDAGTNRDGGAARDGSTTDGGADRDGGTNGDGGTDRDGGTERDAGPCDETWCDGECVDPQVSVAHCGACGFDCAGGACIDGVCQAFVWQDLPGQRPGRLAADADDLYWTIDASAGGVFQRTFFGGPGPVPVATNQSYPDRLVVSDQHVAWTALDERSGPRPGHVRYRDKALAAPLVDVTTATQRSPDGFAIADGRIFWTVDSPLYLRAHPIGTAVDTYAELQFSGGSSFVQTMVADDTYVYWFDANANLFRVAHALVGETPDPMLSNQEEEPKDALLLGDWIYYGDSANGLNTTGWLRRTNKSTFATETLTTRANPDDETHGVYALASDGVLLYYTTEAPSGRLANVWSIPLAGGTPERVAPVTNPANTSARGLAAVDGVVFWSEWTSDGSTNGRIRARRVR